MKKYYSSFLLLLLINNIEAQLTVNNHAPVVGEQHQRYQCDSTGINPGPAGANVLWNFSAATRSSVVHSYTAGSSIYYPPATVSLTSNRSYEDHYRITSNALLDYSSSFPITPSYYINLNYNAPAIKAKYPMTLNTSSTTSTNGNINAIMVNPQAGTYNGTSSTIADGTGTLVLPGITYTNVMRVVNTEVISYNVGFAGTITMKNYDYYAEGAKPPVFSIVTVTLTRPIATVRRTLVTRLIHAIPAAPIDITEENNKLVCDNMSTTLTVSGSGNIEWFDDMNATVAVGSSSVYVTDPLSPGVYTYYAQVSSFLSSTRTAITFTVTDCTSLENLIEEKPFKIFPNPSAGLFNLTLTNDVNFLKVYNSDGKIILSQKCLPGTNTIDLTKQVEGFYIIKLFNKNSLVAVKKLVLQK